DRGGFDADYNSKDTIIQYNYSHNNHWFCGIMKRPNTNVTIRYNLSVNERKGAYFYGFESNTDAVNIKIYNNTHYFKSSISPELMVRDRKPLNSTFNNNIFYAAGSGTMGIDAENGINVDYDTNVYYNITPPVSDTNALLVDPLFVSPGAEPYDVDMKFGRSALSGYKLSAASPYIDAGVTISENGGQDFWGTPVPNGSTDIGAHEYVCPGDANGDGAVNMIDYVIVSMQLGSSDEDADLDGNGLVNGNDLDIVYAHWLCVG
ncbi:MAG: hypothetical protein IID32_01170, partial [Planctomycetes bacterium]|nr:hypothetical protein [Planctomycetota bacterium]